MNEIVQDIVTGLAVTLVTLGIALAILIIGGIRDKRRLERMAKSARPESEKWGNRKGPASRATPGQGGPR